MKRFLVFTILIATASSLAPAQTTNGKVAPGTSLQMEITKIEEEWHNALAKHDAALLDRILADEFLRLGLRAEALTRADNEVSAVRLALGWARAGDLLVCAIHQDRPAVLDLLDQLTARNWKPGQPLPEERHSGVSRAK